MSTPHYQFEFDKDDLQAIRECNEQHGFAIVKEVLTSELHEELKEEVRSVLEPRFVDESIRSATSGAFIEEAPALLKLLRYEPLLRIVRYLNDGESITLNRSAAIYKKPGAAAGVLHSDAMAWHTDWGPLEHPYKTNEVLNNTGAVSCWFYLTGSNPQNGGLSIIPDSHTEDWEGPEGFAFTKNRKSFYPVGTEPKAYTLMDVPGAMAVVTEPRDLVLFAERTYHGVNPHRGEAPRLSCAVSFRKKSRVIEQHWPLSESALRFIESCPEDVRELVEGYLGLGKSWVSSPRA